MRRFLFTVLTLWAIIVGPGLCVAGVLEHLCADCPAPASCEHEEDCASDPCVEPLVIPGTSVSVNFLTPVIVLVATLVAPEVETTDSSSVLLATAFLPVGKNLPVPESDLPLLN